MKIELKLYVSLTEYGKERQSVELDEGTTVSDVLNKFNIPDIAVNTYDIILRVYDPIYGNFIKKITNIIVNYLSLFILLTLSC